MSGSVLVPHISLLGCNRQTLRNGYQNAKQAKVEPMQEKQRKSRQLQSSAAVENNISKKIHWPSTWDEYVRGHVVSESAAQLIQSFLLKTMAVSGGKADDDAESEADKSDDDVNIPRLHLSPLSLQSILAPLSANTW